MARFEPRPRITAGSSVAESQLQFDASDLKVKFQIIVENHTNNVNLQIYQSKQTAGYVSVTAQDVVAKHSQAVMGNFE